jgi:metal-responsive CopG/Arc/MetJ family transcriptional regulator
MRTTISVPEDLVEAVREISDRRSFSEFAREAIRTQVETLREQKLAAAMEKGYEAEAVQCSLDPAWSEIEVEGW